MEFSSNIKDLALEDRPREKFLYKGKDAVSNAELLAILLGSGYRNVSAVDLARKILQKANNDLFQLSRFSIRELMKEKGIGEAKAITIAASLELGRRRKAQERIEKPKITSSRDVYELFRSFFEDLPHEEFRIAILNQANKVIGNELISRGGIAGTVADPRIILKTALEHQAASIILMHNHPSGNLSPSQADLDLTQKIKMACGYIDVQLLDHLIFTDDNYCSLADDSKM